MKTIYVMSGLIMATVVSVMSVDVLSEVKAAQQGFPMKICYHDKVPFERVHTSVSCEILHMTIFEGIDPLHPPKQHPDSDPADCRIHHDIIFE